MYTLEFILQSGRAFHFKQNSIGYIGILYAPDGVTPTREVFCSSLDICVQEISDYARWLMDLERDAGIGFDVDMSSDVMKKVGS